MDKLDEKVKRREMKENQERENRFLEEFKEIYELAKEIKSEQEKMASRKERLKTQMDNLQIQRDILMQMEGLVEQEGKSKAILKDLKNLHSRVHLTETEDQLIKQETPIEKKQEALAIKTFEKLLQKIEIFEALKEVNTMKETTDMINEENTKSQVHINNVIQSNANLSETSSKNSTSYFGSLWKISEFFVSQEVILIVEKRRIALEEILIDSKQ